jgi:uncharacterized membrane protein
MVPLIVVAYAQAHRAEAVLLALTRAGRADLADLNDAWYASRGNNGHVQIERLAGAGSLEDDVSQGFLAELAAELRPESSAVVALIRGDDAAGVTRELVLYGGTIMHSSIPSAEHTPTDGPRLGLGSADRSTLMLAPAEAVSAVILTAGGGGELQRARLARLWWDSIRRFSRALELYPEYVVIESVLQARSSVPGDAAAEAREAARQRISNARNALASIGGEQAVNADYGAFVHTLCMAAAEGAADLSARARAYDVVRELDALLASPLGGTAS